VIAAVDRINSAMLFSSKTNLRIGVPATETAPSRRKPNTLDSLPQDVIDPGKKKDLCHEQGLHFGSPKGLVS
jgi:hypothetical protein